MNIIQERICRDFEKRTGKSFYDLIMLYQLGVTGHEDLGESINKDGKAVYCDKAYLGSLERMIESPADVVNSSPAPAMFRFEFVGREIKKWYSELERMINE